MLNCFYWYIAIWTFILFLFALDFSDFTDALSPTLLIFLLSTMLVALILGILVSRMKLRISEVVEENRIGSREKLFAVAATLLIVIGFIVNFFFQGCLPILGGTYKQAVKGITIDPAANFMFYVPLIILSIVLSFYLSYLFVATMDWRLLILDTAVVLMLILNGSRGYSVYCLFVFLMLLMNKRIKKISIKVVISGCALAIICFIIGGCFFGALGNIRSGFAWNDNSYAIKLGRYHSNVPAFLAQFAWIYMYLTTPLSNLSLNFTKHDVLSMDILGSLRSLIPQTFSGTLPSGSKADLIASYLTAGSGYIDAYISAGIVGCILYFALFAGYMFIMIWAVNRLGYYVSLMQAVLVLYVFLNTFLPPLYDVSCAYAAPLILCAACIRKIFESRGQIFFTAIRNEVANAQTDVHEAEMK